MPDPSIALVTIAGPAYDLSGYATVTHNFVRNLLGWGIPVRLVPLFKKYPNCLVAKTPESGLVFEGREYVRPIQETLRNDLLDALRVPFYADRILVLNAPPPMWPGLIKRAGHFERIIGSACFEASQTPAEWIPFYECVHEIWVPTHWNYDIFLEGGAPEDKLRIVNIGYGVPEIATRPPKAPHEPFRFLSVFQWQERKGPEILLDAFSRLPENCQLTVISRKNNGVSARKDFDRLTERFDIDASRCVLLDSELSYNALEEMYDSHDAFVSASCGEGFLLPGLEAMAHAMPIICSDHGGQLEYANKANAWLCEGQEITDGENCDMCFPAFSGLSFYAPFVFELRDCMAQAMNGDGYGKKSKNALKTAQKFSLSNFRNDLAKALNLEESPERVFLSPPPEVFLAQDMK